MALGHQASVWQDPPLPANPYERYPLVYAKVALGVERPRPAMAASDEVAPR
jgi:hypothetical protein